MLCKICNKNECLDNNDICAFCSTFEQEYKMKNLDSIQSNPLHQSWKYGFYDIETSKDNEAKIKKAKKLHYILFLIGIIVFILIVWFYFVVIFTSNLLN